MYTKSICEFGAVGDGLTSCTQAIQAAIDDCAASGGGSVIIEDGEYVTGTVFMKSNVTLELRSTARLLAGLEPEDYPDFAPCFDKTSAPRRTARCLIYAENCRSIAIRGGGVIDCRGENFCEFTPHDRFYRRKTDRLPARMIFFYQCSDVTLEGFSIFEMAGGWAMWLNACDRVSVSRLRIVCNPLYPNSDGIHINCSADVTVSDCVIHCGDDALILRANTKTLAEKRPCERISVTNCTIKSKSCAVRVGWTNDYLIRDCVFSNLAISDSWYGISIEFPKKPPEPFADQGYDRTVVKRLAFSNIVMSELETAPIRILAYPYNDVESVSDISFRGILANAKELPIFRVEKGVVVRDITLADCTFEASSDEAAMNFTNISGVNFNNVTIRNA